MKVIILFSAGVTNYYYFVTAKFINLTILLVAVYKQPRRNWQPFSIYEYVSLS